MAVGGGNVCPCDGQNYWIRKFDSTGTFLFEWGNNGPSSALGKFTRPGNIALDQSGKVYVLEPFAARVQVFDSDGNFLSVINSTASGDGHFFDAPALTVDSSGNVYIGDKAGQRIQKFDPAGNFVTKWGGPGTGDGQFNTPIDITLTPGGIFYVTDGLNHRIQKFGVAVLEVAIDIKPGSDPNCFNINGHGVVPVAILGAANLDVTQIDVASLDFAGLDVAVRGKNKLMAHTDDVNADGIDDLVVQFEDEDGAFVPGDGEATVMGQLTDGPPPTQIEGADSICIVP